ncbi:hypothetical protein [Dysgonomonas termitidis]|uniref:Uncharacterized protein n=1 Tax=Dysgonomonas termitidis TaxID=1516126 RepID=A0ABV9KSU3_9BACT
MQNNWPEKDYRLAVLLRIWWWIPLIFVIATGVIKDCAGNGIDPMDDSILKNTGIVGHVMVMDSTYNGFRVVYVTAGPVTGERLEEIKSREHITGAFERLQHDAPVHFGSLLETDIYDFAVFAKKYDTDKDIKIHNIFVEGPQKKNLYLGPNPMIENPAVWIDENTDQGVQYLKSDDIYFLYDKPGRIYRYWKCRGIHSMSATDERFSHFSEDERIR